MPQSYSSPSSSVTNSSRTSTSVTSTGDTSGASRKGALEVPEKRPLKYTAPEWFLAHNTKTPAELENAEPAIALCDEDPPSTTCVRDGPQERKHTQQSRFDDDWAGYYVHNDLYAELLDTTASAFVRDPKGRLALYRHGVALRSTAKGGSEFLDEVVLQMAKDLGVTLVSVSLEDIEDMGWEFDRQEQELDPVNDASIEKGPEPEREFWEDPALHYFTADSQQKEKVEVWDRCKRAFTAILDAPRQKAEILGPSSEAYPGLADVTTKRPFLLYFRDVKRMEDIERNCSFLHRLQDFVEERRRSGEPIVLVSAFSHGGTPDEHGSTSPLCPWMPCHCDCWICECQCSKRGYQSLACEPQRIRGMLGSKKDPIITLTPSKVTQKMLEKHQRKGEGVPAEYLNLRRLQRALRLEIPHLFALGALHPVFDWSEQLGTNPPDETTWSMAEIERATAQIVGRAWRRPQLELDDVRTVLRRMKLLNGDNSQGESNFRVNGDMREKKSSAWAKKMRDVRAQCNAHEEALLSCVINPDDLQSTYDDVVLDPEVKQTIKHLVFRSQLMHETTPHDLLSQVKIKGALLYGPPGTGKTHLGRALAKDSGATMLAIDCAAMHSQWVGETEKYIRAAFSLAAKLSPCILFIDEVDSLFYHRRFNDKPWERSAITQFLTEMDGLEQRAGAPFVMVATNRPMDLDDAFLRRLPQKIPLGLPDRQSRTKILRLFLGDEDLDPLVNVDAIATLTEGYTGSDLRNLCAEAALLWTMEQTQAIPSTKSNKGGGDGEEPSVADPQGPVKLRLTKPHFAKALAKIRPTVSRAALGDLNKFTRRFTPVAPKGNPATLAALKGKPNPPAAPKGQPIHPSCL